MLSSESLIPSINKLQRERSFDFKIISFIPPADSYSSKIQLPSVCQFVSVLLQEYILREGGGGGGQPSSPWKRKVCLAVVTWKLQWRYYPIHNMSPLRLANEWVGRPSDSLNEVSQEVRAWRRPIGNKNTRKIRLNMSQVILFGVSPQCTGFIGGGGYKK